MSVVIVYIDDILIFTEDLQLHRKVVSRVLQILRENGLYLKAEKCKFEQPKVEYLDLIISHGQMAMDPVKVEGVSKWPKPTCVKEVQSFLGFVNFYRRFIEGFAGIARPVRVLPLISYFSHMHYHIIVLHSCVVTTVFDLLERCVSLVLRLALLGR